MEKAVIYCYHGALMFLLAASIRSVVVRVKVCCYRIAGGKEGAEKNSARICYPPLLRTNNQFSVEPLVPCDCFLPTEERRKLPSPATSPPPHHRRGGSLSPTQVFRLFWSYY